MEYTSIYELILELHNINNTTKKYCFYYDETNNPRLFKLTDKGFNVNEKSFFILGGLVFPEDRIPLDEQSIILIKKLNLQSSSMEIKFKHISGKSKDFLELMTKKKVQDLIDWIFFNDYFIHYSFVDNFYFSIVDIVDSLEESTIGDIDFNRSLKDSLYELIKKNKEWFINLLIKVNYPNINNHKYFVEEVINLIFKTNENDDFNLEYLRQSFKNYRNKQLIFLENNDDCILISDYTGWYINSIITYPNSAHFFDNEDFVEKKIEGTRFNLFDKDFKNYEFIDSKSNIYIQISDLIVGILRMWMFYIEFSSQEESNLQLGRLSNESRISIHKLQMIMLNSLNESKGFKNGVSSNSFELKLNQFLEYDFLNGSI